MLDKSDTPISEVMKVFASYGQEAGYIVPTVTGMDKDILDAHGSLREFLKSKGIHDFDFQGQGGEHKKLVDIFLINEDSILETKMSLYRPETKSGDPRLWIYGLPKYAAPFNLLAFLFLGEKLYLINTSNPRLLGKSSALLGSPIKVISTRESSKQISIFEDSSNVEKTDNKITLKAEPLKELLQYQSNNLDRTESALIKKLEIISLQGFIDSL